MRGTWTFWKERWRLEPDLEKDCQQFMLDWYCWLFAIRVVAQENKASVLATPGVGSDQLWYLPPYQMRSVATNLKIMATKFVNFTGKVGDSNQVLSNPNSSPTTLLLQHPTFSFGIKQSSSLIVITEFEASSSNFGTTSCRSITSFFVDLIQFSFTGLEFCQPPI